MKRTFVIINILILISIGLTGCIDNQNLKTTLLELGKTIRNNDIQIKNNDNTNTDGSSIKVQNIPTPANWDKTNCEWIDSIQVLDGDTLKQGNDTIRLIGIDTPESDNINNQFEYYSKEAKFFVSDKIGGSRICLKKDSTLSDIDKYGRKLRYVYLEDGTFMNDSLVRWGYGKTINSYFFEYLEVFNRKEAMAKSEKLGIWNEDNKSNYIKTYGENDISELMHISKISSDIASEFIGRTVEITTTINSTYNNNGEIYLNSEKEYGNAKNFTIIIPKLSVQDFSGRKINPLSYYRRKSVSIKGFITEEKGKPRITITKPEDIFILTNPVK